MDIGKKNSGSSTDLMQVVLKGQSEDGDVEEVEVSDGFFEDVDDDDSSGSDSHQYLLVR
jgi:hypothetical protein